MDVHLDTGSDDKCVFGSPVLCQEMKRKGREKRPDRDKTREKKDRERYPDQSVGT